MRRYATQAWALLATSSLAPAAYAAKPVYAGIYAQAVTANNDLSLSNKAFNQGTSAFNNPFVTGVMLTTTWASIEPLPPGISFCGGTGLCSGAATLSVAANGGSAAVTITCVDANHGYCWDTIDRQLDLIAPNAAGTTTLSIGLDIHAGYHSPAWLSNSLITVNLDTTGTNADQTGAATYFTGPEVTAAQPPSGTGTYSNLGTLDCATYESATGVIGSTSTACTNGQAVTNWIGVTGGNPASMGACHAVRLPVPWGIDGNGHPKVAPFAQLYVDMLVALQSHVNTYVSQLKIAGFSGLTTVIKLGSAMAGEDAEFTLLGGNNTGTTTDILPSEVGATSIPPATNCPNNIESYWQTLDVGYNPRIVEETWEYIANSVGASFNVATTGILLDIDVHDDPTSTFPDIAFQETNSTPGVTFSTDTYSQSADGAYLQDDVIFCDLIGTWALGQTINLELGGGNVGTTTTTMPYYAGFVSGSSGTCLTSGSHAHQPLTYSLTGSVPYTWGIEEDGLVPIPDTGVSSTGSYAHGAATQGLELSWGTNQSGSLNPNVPGNNNSDGGAACDSAGDGCSTFATSATAECPAGSGTTCVLQFESMLDSGLYRYMVARPYNASNPSYQMYMLYPVDLCNPFLWHGLQKTYAALNGVDLTTPSLAGTMYTDCSGNDGTFSTAGSWSLLP